MKLLLLIAALLIAGCTTQPKQHMGTLQLQSVEVEWAMPEIKGVKP